MGSVYVYIISMIVFVYCMFFVYMRLSYPFWSKQPVFHFHLLHYFFKTDTYIYTNTSQMTAYRYIDIPNVKLMRCNTIEDYQTNKYLIDSYFSLVRKHYLNTNNSIFNPSDTYMLHTLFNETCTTNYIALYCKKKTFNAFEKNALYVTSVFSGLTSKKIVLYRHSCPAHLRTVDIHYVDFLCTHKEHRKQNITPTLIYTYAYQVMKQKELENQGQGQGHSQGENNSRNHSRNVAFMFKREGEKQSFVPYTVYSNFVFDLQYFSNKSIEAYTNQASSISISPTLRVEYINGDSFEILLRALEKIKQTIHSFLHVDYGVIKTYIEQKIMHVFVVHTNGEPSAIYAFKNNCFYYQTHPVYECISSIYFSSSLFDDTTFHYFFYKSITMLMKVAKVRYINIENICCNASLIHKMRQHYQEIYSYVNTFYLYNYILTTTRSKDIFMLL